MRPLPDHAGSDCTGEASSDHGSALDAYTGETDHETVIKQANKVPLITVLRHHGLRFSEYNRKVSCPFKAHKNGKEQTPSFYWYPDTNSFYCYGCHVGGKHAHAVHFVAEMDRCSKIQAAYKILDQFEADIDEDAFCNRESDFSERLAIMQDFSVAVREFRRMHPDAHEYIEAACQRFDELNLKHALDNQALSRLVSRLKDYLGIYGK
jgi:DNA primase